MKSIAIIGAGFGDEGKGSVVNRMCSLYTNPLVIRFSGGHQAGHHVIYNSTEHIFSNFGSGTLKGVPTYWSKFCTFDPIGILNEYDRLKSKNVDPIIFIDEECPVTTPYEKVKNNELMEIDNHGSCGVGFGQTIQREEDFYSITAYDLQFPTILEKKLSLLETYYGYRNKSLDDFFRACIELSKTDGISVVRSDFLSRNEINYNVYIFEGSQGLMLDQHFGFFPHVTRSNIGTKNILELGYVPEVYLVTRAYQTRHGNGPMTNEHKDYNVKDNPYEINLDTSPQGKFRKSMLDLDLIKYVVGKDKYIKNNEYTLIITCCDVVRPDYRFTRNNGRVFVTNNILLFRDEIRKELGISNIYMFSLPQR